MHTRDGAVDPQFAKLMLALAEVLGVVLTEQRHRFYARLLSDVPLDQLRVAFGRAANSCRGGCFPSPGELRAFIGPAEGDAALLAWAALSRAVTDVGAYASVDVEDGATAEALVNVFSSWPELCSYDDGPALALKRQEFLAAFRQAQRMGAKGRRLPGSCEASGSYPTGEAAGALWAGRITASGQVLTGRDQRQLTEGDHGERAALPEAGATKTGEGENGA